MIGIVTVINTQNGMVAIETEEGHTIIELLADDDIEMGDELCWSDGTGLGDQEYFNKTKHKLFDCYAQNHHVTKAQLSQQLLLNS